MNTDKHLEKMYEMFIQEIEDKYELNELDFVLKHCYPWLQWELDKQYVTYKEWYDEDPEDILSQSDWQEEVYLEENKQDLEQYIEDAFTSYWIEVYKNPNGNIIEANIAWWWPTIDLYIECRNESVTWEWYWWWDRFERDCSHYFNKIMDLYNLTNYDERHY